MMWRHSWVTRLTRTTSSCSDRTGVPSWSEPGMSSTTSACRTWRRTSSSGLSGTPGRETLSSVWWRESLRRIVTITFVFWPNKTTTVSWSVELIPSIRDVAVISGIKMVVTRWHANSLDEVIVLTIQDTIQLLCSQVSWYFWLHCYTSIHPTFLVALRPAYLITLSMQHLTLVDRREECK